MFLTIILCLPFLLLIGCFDWYYHVNSIWTIISGLCMKKKNLKDTYSIYRLSSVLNTDSTFDHLNNVKYLMYMDFGREDYWCRSGLFKYLWSARAFPLQSASIIRYMRPIPIFTPIRLDTKLVWWDEKMIYLEHQFVIRKSGFVAAIALSRVCFERHNIERIFQEYPGGAEKPDYPERLRPWIEALSKSSREIIKEHEIVNGPF